MHDIFAPVALSGKVCDLNTVGSVNVVSLDMISTPPPPALGINYQSLSVGQ